MNFLGKKVARATFHRKKKQLLDRSLAPSPDNPVNATANDDQPMDEEIANEPTCSFHESVPGQLVFDDNSDPEGAETSQGEDEGGDRQMFVDDDFDLQINETLETTNSNRSPKEILARKTMELKIKHRLSQAAVTSFMKLSNETNQAQGLPATFPNSFYSLEKNAGFAKLKFLTGFNCESCGDELLLSLNEQTNCDCGHAINKNYLIGSEHFFVFDLAQLIALLVQEYGLKQPVVSRDGYRSFCDGEVYERLLTRMPGKQVITLQLSCDGVELTDCSKKQMWPLFAKLNELDSAESKKIFLLACFIGYHKPKVGFFFDSIVDQLNNLYQNGLFVQSLNERVYPLLLNFMLDMPAKALFLNHSGHTATFGCTVCKIEGQTLYLNGNPHSHKTIFHPLSVRQYKSETLYRNLQNKPLPFFGVLGLSKLHSIEYIDAFEICPPESMHSIFINFVPRILDAMFKFRFRKSICSLYGKEEVLNQRIQLFGSMDMFKRKPRSIDQRAHFNASEHLTWFFYVAPIVLRGLMRRQGYGYLMLLVYAVSNFWRGLKKNEIKFNHNMIRIFLEDLKSVFDEGEYTISAHQLLHLKHLVEKFGPIAHSNSFAYESANGDCRRLIKGTFAMNEQVGNEYSRVFNLNLEKSEAVETGLNQFGPFQEADRSCFKKIVLNGSKFTSRRHHLNQRPGNERNNVVKLESGEFFSIEYFFIEDDEMFAYGQALAKTRDLGFVYGQIGLSLDYISCARLDSEFTSIPLKHIVNKVHLVQEFERGGAEHVGDFYVIDLVHIFHN